MKVVINRCYGGFGLSFDACKRYLELKGKDCVFYKGGFSEKKIRIENPSDGNWDVYISTKDLGNITDEIPSEFFWYSGNISDRSDTDLVKVIEEMGDKANTRFSKLKIVDIPDNISYEIDEYDGMESVQETHQSWC